MIARSNIVIDCLGGSSGGGEQIADVVQAPGHASAVFGDSGVVACKLAEPICRDRQDVLDRTEAEKLTPPSNVLCEMARRSPPPQEWWDEDFEGM